jgi:hypothetical protein
MIKFLFLYFLGEAGEENFLFPGESPRNLLSMAIERMLKVCEIRRTDILPPIAIRLLAAAASKLWITWRTFAFPAFPI